MGIRTGLIISSMDDEDFVYIELQLSRDSLSSSLMKFPLDIHSKRFTACIIICLCDKWLPQHLAVLNSILPDNLLIYGQPNAKTFQAYFQTLIEMSGSASIFTDYQRTIMFQISSDQDPAPQIAELDSFYIRLHENDYNVLSALGVITLLSTISHSQNSISASILFSHISISNLTWDIVHSAVQTKLFRWTNTVNATCHFDIPHGNKLLQWKKNSQQQQQLQSESSFEQQKRKNKNN